ncbi:MAG: DUF6261 family protein [Prevotellaceae bacterium]|jgi:hypothetical protein|nr:DUF6261 family protein [Prevotellaceae bacterium]
MDITLNKPDVGRYTNANHIEFHKTSLIICDRHANVINAPDLLAGYHEKVTQEEGVYKWTRSSEFTEKKAEVDRERDNILSGIMDALHASSKHFDPSIRDNAKHVLNLVNNYGDLTHAGYDAETAGIDSIVTKLNGRDYIYAVQALHLEPWLTELTRLNSLFKGYAADAEQEQVRKPDISPKTVRRETDEALRNVTNRVTALIDLNGPGAYVQFVDEFNVHVNHYNTLVHEHYGRLHARTDISSGEVDTIAVQPYTGEPVYVIPKVRIRKTGKDGTVTVVELRFSEDFTVGYKNNVDPGSATITITGIGKYAGKIITTFNIAAEV